mgnify:CR=1 FL=1
MEQKIKIFENEEFGKVRTIIKDGEPWFVGKDVAKILEYRNTKKALSDHVDEEDKYQGDGCQSFIVHGVQAGCKTSGSRSG